MVRGYPAVDIIPYSSLIINRLRKASGYRHLNSLSLKVDHITAGVEGDEDQKVVPQFAGN
jgi:hypothetical protein